jgi:hypothetical protein
MSFEQDAGYPRSVVGHYIAWTPVIAGALVATALSTILLAFGAAVGLGVASTAPTWRDASVALWLLSGLYLILVALISFGVGGYIAGHIRVAGPSADPADVEHRDGAHGLCAWAVAVVLGAIIAALLGVALTRAPAAQGTSLSSAGAAEPLLSYELDRMFRPARRAPNAESPMERAEAGRILLTASGHDGVATEDRTYLVQLVGGVTGLAGADAERRVDTAIANAKTAIARSRRSAIIVAFSIATSLLLGAIAAWAAATEGGRHRDGAPVPHWLRPGPLVAPRPHSIP